MAEGTDRSPTADRRRRAIAIAAAAALAALVVIAVVALSSSGTSTRRTTTTTHRRPSTSAGVRTAATKTARAVTRTPLRTVQFSPDGSAELRLAIYDLRRDGPFVTLDFTATCVGTNQSCGGYDAFGFHFFEGEGTFGADSLDGIRLLDPVNDKLYRAVQDANQNVWQSKLDISLEAPRSELLWVRFPAPPAGVSALDLLFSNGGPQLRAVPVTTAAAGPTVAQVGGGAERPAPATFAKPPSSTDPSGLVLPVSSLVLTVGNRTSADAESPGSAAVTLSSDVLFRFAKATLTPAARTTLHTLATDVAKRALGTVTVAGYTDGLGSDAVNDPLSRARARAVVGALRPLTPGVSYVAQGFGKAHPVAPNTRPDGSDNPAGRALNRRVTIRYRVKTAAAPAPPSAAPARPAPAAATGTITYRAASGSTYAVRVDHLAREGNLVLAGFSARCLDHYGHECDFKNDFGAEVPSQGTVSVPPVPESANSIAGFDGSYSTADALYLQDAAGTIYNPVRDDAGLSSSAAVANLDSLGSGQGPKPFESLWAYFPAPPAAVSTVALVLPGGHVAISGVPVAASPGG